MNNITVISLFDGMSCGQIALDKLGIKVDRYFASEVDKYAMSVTNHNYPDTIQIGDVQQINFYRMSNYIVLKANGKRYKIYGKVLLIGGSPCQGFSFAGKMKGASTKCNIDITTLEQYQELKDDGFEFQGQSYLFWEYVKVLRKIKPDNFLLENVMMVKKWKYMINEAVGCDPYMINSALVSAQNRKRLYWTNIKRVRTPRDKGIVIADILEDVVDDKYSLSDEAYMRLVGNKEKNQEIVKNVKKPCVIYANGGDIQDKSGTLLASYAGGVSNFGTDPYIVTNVNPSGKGMNGRICHSDYKHTTLTTNKGQGPKVLIVPENTKKGFIEVAPGECWDNTFANSKTRRGRSMKNEGNTYRKLTPKECERLQTVPDDYTNIVSNSQRYKMLGNGWTVDVVCHILFKLKL